MSSVMSSWLQLMHNNEQSKLKFCVNTGENYINLEGDTKKIKWILKWL